MRIAIVAGPHVPVPPVKYGGSELVIYNLINGLMELGHEPILIGAGDSVVPCELIPIVKKSIFFPRTKASIAQFNVLEKTANKLTAKKLKELMGRVDIVHSHGFDMLKFNDFPNVTTMHNPIDFENLDYFLERKHLNWVCISKNQQQVVRSLNYAGVVYNGEDPDKYPFVATPEDYVCFLGRFDRDKNPHLAIQLAIALGVKIKLAGKIDYRSEGYFQEEIAKHFDNPLVEYLGEIGIERKKDIVGNAKCNFHPVAFREPFGLTVLEAALCGTPTLAINRGSMAELIEHGKTGMLVEDFPEGYSAAAKCFKMDREYIAKRARRLFNYRKMARGYVSVYERVIKNYGISNK